MSTALSHALVSECLQGHRDKVLMNPGSSALYTQDIYAWETKPAQTPRTKV